MRRKSLKEVALLTLKFKLLFLIQNILLTKKNPPNSGANGVTKEYHWSLPRLTPQEKFFVSQIITSPSKDVGLSLI
jgi:hypothetical protein